MTGEMIELAGFSLKPTGRKVSAPVYYIPTASLDAAVKAIIAAAGDSRDPGGLRVAVNIDTGTAREAALRAIGATINQQVDELRE